MSSAVLEGLNSEQLQAVKCVEGPVLIVAGAGSGKTRVLTCRIANILGQGCDPKRVLALTFTKKAANEMKERIALMVGEKRARRLCMGTFHSVFIRFLREYAASLGYPESFTIYDTSDSVSAIKACIKELKLDDKVYKPKDVLSRISNAKNNLFTAGSYRANANAINADIQARKGRLCEIFTLYEQKCRQAGVMDFDDILLNMNILLRDNKEALADISGRFSYIMVDEYQDTNYAQYIILRRLTLQHHNICVVGDDSQSIYAFRGANISNILNFNKDFPECKTFRLERNYRSTQTIVNASNSLIANNNGRIPKKCYAVGDAGEKIHLLKAYTEGEEASMVVREIVSLMQREKAEYKDFAILYRTNSQSRVLEEALRTRNLPYMIYSGNSFFERAEVKDLMAYFKLVVNPQDDESFKRVVNKPARGIGDTSMDALERMARAHETSLFKAIAYEDYEIYGLKNAAVTRLKAFRDLIDGMAVKVGSTEAHEMALRIADKSGLYADYKQDNSIEGLARVANLDELLNSVASYVEEQQNEYIADQEVVDAADVDAMELPLITLDGFLENISLLSNVDVTEEEDSSNRIALMTVHSAKGLEFPYVFVTGMEENLFPSGGMLASPADVEEERRLFYVAVTRAKSMLELSFSRSRMRNGKHESNRPSRFIREIDSEYYSNPLSDNDMQEEEEDSSVGFRFGSAGGSHFGSSDGGFRYGSSGSRYSGSSEVKHFRGGSAAGSRPVQGPMGRPTAARPAPSAVSRSIPPTATRPAPPAGIPDADFEPSPIADFAVGQKVEHQRFGLGIITAITGRIPDLRASITFTEFGDKVIMLKYSKLRIVK